MPVQHSYPFSKGAQPAFIDVHPKKNIATVLRLHAIPFRIFPEGA